MNDAAQKNLMYVIELSANLGAMVPSVGEMLKGLNNAMAGFGFSEKMMLRSRFYCLQLTVNRELTAQEENEIGQLVIEQFAKDHPEWELRVEGFKLHQCLFVGICLLFFLRSISKLLHDN